jgi:uncharacterized protein YdhG (YjbR/CyaY superfamily)
MPTCQSHEEYFATVPAPSRALLEHIQAEVEARVPGATRCISYRMPAFRLQRTFFYFAAFKKHIGIYPPVTADRAVMRATAPYRGGKGNLSFPLHEPLPIELIGRVARALADQYRAP